MMFTLSYLPIRQELVTRKLKILISQSNYATNYKGKNQNSKKTDQTMQRGGYSNKARGRGKWNNNNRPRCQICEKLEHTAAKCYFRLNLNYVLGQNSNNQRNQSLSANVTQVQYNLSNQSDNKDYHQTEAAKPKHIHDEDWYPDSGATNHITNNLSNLNLENMEYKDINSIHMSNGKSIAITH